METSDEKINDNHSDSSSDGVCDDVNTEVKVDSEPCSDATYLAQEMLLKEKLSREDAMVRDFKGSRSI